MNEKEARRAARMAAWGNRVIDLPTKCYVVLYVDPPWQVTMWSQKGMDRSAENHYPTMTDAEIGSLWDKLPAADDCVLFLWATAPKLKTALEVMDSWGFDYKSFLAWDKEIAGTGYLVRSQVELLLIGTRGLAVPPQGLPGIIVARRGRHSKKPDEVAEMIAEQYPDVPKLEMFARAERAGWDVWGNEVA